MNVVFRTDASHSIGTGHVMRCLTLGSALRARGAEVSFICRQHEGHMCEVIEGRGFPVARLSAPAAGFRPPGSREYSDWLGTHWQEDADQSCLAIEKQGLPPDWLVVDHYALDGEWEGFLRSSVARILVIDDLADRKHHCDALLNQNLLQDPDRLYTDKLPPDCSVMLGPAYALLQPIYAELHERASPRSGPIRRICISFGGSDSANVTGCALAAFLCLNRPDIGVDVVVPEHSPHLPSIRHQVNGHENLHLHTGLPTLAPLFANADLAIGAAGTTSLERLSLGLPSIVVILAENQRAVADELHRRGLIRSLGDLHGVDQSAIQREIAGLVEQGLDGNWSRRCLSVTDGKGADRVCDAMVPDLPPALRVRHAAPADESLLFEWANDATARQNSFSPEAIPHATHREWFRTRLANADGCRIYVIEAADGVPIGLVRFERSGPAWEIHFSLGTQHRGRGLGRPMLQAALRRFRADVRRARIFGLVKNQNQPSRRIFERLGFEIQPGAGQGYTAFGRNL